MAINPKEIINPFILFPLILIITFLTGARSIKLFQYSFIFFLIFSISNSLRLVIFKIARKRIYLFFYAAMFFSLVFIIPLFYIIKIENPLLNSFFILGITDFIIQGFYNITPKKDVKEIINDWKDKLIKSERVWFHPISLQKYIFKDFAVTIIDSESVNPANLHINHLHPLEYKRLPSHIYKHMYGGKSYLFHLYLKKPKINKEKNLGNKTIKGMRTNPELIKKFSELDSKTSKHIITAYRQGKKVSEPSVNNEFVKNETAYIRASHDLKIAINKRYVQNNPKRVYSFLAKCNKFFSSKPK